VAQAHPGIKNYLLDMHRRLQAWWKSKRQAQTALEQLHIQQDEGDWHCLVPRCVDNVAERVTQEGDMDLVPSMIPESNSASRNPQETSVLHQMSQRHPIEGVWVLENTNPGLIADMSFFTIEKDTLFTASRAVRKLTQGPTRNTMLLADGCLRLMSDEVLRLSSNSGSVVLLNRHNNLCRRTLATLQGRWKYRGTTRYQMKTMAIQGIVYHLSSQDFHRRQTSRGLLQCWEGDVTMNEFTVKIIAQNAFLLRSPSGHAWRFSRQ